MQVLGFEKWEFIDREESDHDIRVRAIAPHSLSVCSQCNPTSRLHHHGRREQLFMDTPSLGKRLGLLVLRQRYRCATCNSVFYQPLPEMDEKRSATKRLIEYIQKQSVKRPFLTVSEDVGLDEKTIRNIFDEYVEKLDDHSSWESSEWIGIDEVYIGRAFRCVITDLKKRSLLDMLPDRRYSTVADRLYRRADKTKVSAVCMDMHQTYREVVKDWLDSTAIVADRFHVVKLVMDAFDKVRKQTSRALKLKTKQNATLRKEAAELMFTNRHQLDEGERFRVDEWLLNSPELAQAYRLKESFCDIYLLKDRHEAQRRYQSWKYEVPEKSPFAAVARSIDNWYKEVFNYFDFPLVTNAYTESVNNLIKLTNLIGRGYSFEVLRAKCLYSEGHFKTKVPKFQKRWSPRPGMLDAIDLLSPYREPEKPSYVVVVDAPLSALITKFEHGEL